ncbi:MAG TPA: hypothetical protein VGA37_02150 [Gemmatimonadales bacterium]
MSDPNEVHVELTVEQQELVEKITGRKSAALRFSIAELEERIVPSRYPQIG